MHDKKTHLVPRIVVTTLMAGALAVLPACGGSGDTGAGTDATAEQALGEDLTIKKKTGNTPESAGDKLHSDDTQLVFQDETGSSKTVFKHDGETITGMATYVDYGDVQTAQAVAKQLSEDGSSKVYADGTYVVFEYDANGYADLTLEDVQANYSHLRQI